MADSRRHSIKETKANDSIFRAYYYLTKPGIVYSNVMTGLAGYLYASRWHIDVVVLIGLMLGMSLIIAAACVFNNYLDKSIDAKMARTASRALVTGKIKTHHALLFATVLTLVGFLLLDLTNQTTLLLGFVAIVSYVIVYGYFKRHSVYGTLVGTIPGAASLVAGYTAKVGHLNLTALLFFVIMLTWQMAHFYAISLYRFKDYKEAGLPIWPVKRGKDSTIKQIHIFVYLFILANIALVVLRLHRYVYLILMLIVSIYWLMQTQASSGKDIEAWAKKVFLRSLIVILVLSLALSTAYLLP
jgi:protoheme IX farnesyltransferase